MLLSRFWICILLCCTFCPTVMAQSAKTLSVDELKAIVLLYHPVAKQAQIQIDKAKANVVSAKGNFDPKLNGYSGAKTFGGVDYYNEFYTGLTIPTWYGVDFVAGIDVLSGERLDPSQSVNDNSFLGFQIPLAQGLLFDKRRAALQQAQTLQNLAEAERLAVQNNLVMEAVEQYWKWLKAYEVLKLYLKLNEQNINRLDFVRKTVQFGERPAIDTVEASTQLLFIENRLNEAKLNVQLERLALSAYLWTTNVLPYTLPEDVTPPMLWEDNVRLQNEPNLPELLQLARLQHPELLSYDSKLDYLRIEKKLKQQELLPKVDLKYNLLSKGSNPFYSIGETAGLQNNYQYGIKAELPLLFRQGRGNYKAAQLKFNETRLQKDQKAWQIEMKLTGYWNEFVSLRQQVKIQNQNCILYKQLVQAETMKFENGESSLFLINSREVKEIEAQEKLIDLKTKFHKSFYALQWSAGLLK